jgi:Flp pilus assembly protein TadG
MAIVSRKHRNEKGQALVEFTLMFPIFLAVFIGLMAISIVFYSYVTTQLAVREGTNAIVHDPGGTTILKDPAGPVAAVQKIVRANSFAFDSSALSILVEPSDPSLWLTGVQVSVSAVYYVPLPTVNMYLPGGANLRLGPIPIKAVSIMTIE